MPGSFVNSLITLCDQGGIPNLTDLKSGRDGHCSFAAWMIWLFGFCSEWITIEYIIPQLNKNQGVFTSEQ